MVHISFICYDFDNMCVNVYRGEFVYKNRELFETNTAAYHESYEQVPIFTVPNRIYNQNGEIDN